MKRLVAALTALALLCFAPAPALAQMSFSNPSAAGGTVLCQGAVQVSHTGDTVEFTFATCTIPANSMGKNGQILVEADFSNTNSANNKTLRIRFGGTAILAPVVTTTTQNVYRTRISNRGATNSQRGLSVATGFAASSAAAAATAIDTTADTTITITGQLALGTETVSLESYSVILYPKS